ncbi:MAG: hypothetical protein ACLSVD_02845 [Eggerthellaceae bacterium]
MEREGDRHARRASSPAQSAGARRRVGGAGAPRRAVDHSRRRREGFGEARKLRPVRAIAKAKGMERAVTTG